MAENNNFEGSNDIAQFLEKFKEQSLSAEQEPSFYDTASEVDLPSAEENRSFEKLERKIQELEERFEESSAQNRLILSELAHTREVMDRQKNRDAFLEHMSRTIATLKTSVENLSRVQQTYPIYEPPFERGFDSARQPKNDYLPTAAEELQQVKLTHAKELSEKEKAVSSLRKKASQLKAVNSALDREIKKVQQEKMEALKKSAEQAKEILSLREQLTAAEDRFKSFNFEGRIISIRQAYQQKVSSLEIQLKEVSDTCMKQVEEIESLKAENLKLHQATQERDALQVRLQKAEDEVAALKQEMEALRTESSASSEQQMMTFQTQLQQLEAQRDGIAAQLAQATESLEAVRHEKELLEKNFKELLSKISDNDAVIGQLKQKIEVLNAQNETLSNSNRELEEKTVALSARAQELEGQTSVLSARNQELEGQASALSTRNQELEGQASALNARTQELEGQTSALSARNKELEGQAAALNARNEELNRQAQQLGTDRAKLSQYAAKLNQDKHALEHANQTLAQENKQLRNQSAALLAAHLVQQKEKSSKENPPASQTLQPVTVSVKKPAPEISSEKKSSFTPAAQEKKESFAPKKAPVQTEADLPEIRIPKPVPQPQVERDAEDFLEKTDTFFGRMKWSIFGEDK